MSQTDRQTDKLSNLAELRALRSTWWEVTAFIPENIDKMSDVASYPAAVAKVYGGLEKCPTTGTVHFQGAVQCRSQQRGSVINDWLPRTHFSKAISSEAIKKYCMKKDTAVGDKTVRENPIKFYTADEICMLIASKVSDETIASTADKKFWYKVSVNLLLRDNVKLAGQLMNPSLRNFWCDTAYVWIDKSREKGAEDEQSESEEEP